MRQYAIGATVTRTVDGWSSTRTLPTFYLHGDVQGITGENGAQMIAERMLRDVAGAGAELYVWAVEV